MSLMRNTPDRSYTGKAKELEGLDTKVVDIVKEAVEAGDIDVYWTAIKDSENRVIGVQFKYYNLEDGIESYLKIFNSEDFTGIKIEDYLGYAILFSSIQANQIIVSNLLGRIYELGDTTSNNSRRIYDTTGSAGTAGQVLGKDANNVLNWITPSHLYRHRIWIVGVCRIENTDAMVYASLDLFSTSNANFTMSNLLAELSTDATQQIMATGMIGDENDKVYSIFGAFKDNNKVSFKCFTSGDVDPHITEQPEGYTIGLTDTVTQIL